MYLKDRIVEIGDIFGALYSHYNQKSHISAGFFAFL